MGVLIIDYKIKMASAASVRLHLMKCKDNFIPALDKVVDITEYSKKIVENSITFEAWVNNNLAGLVAAYFNDKKNHSGFITNVSIVNEYAGKGLASNLLKNCIEYGKQKKFKEISLEVFHNNKQAIKLYNKNNFTQIAIKGDFVFMRKIL